jgi:hypothetical protein
MAAQQFWLNSLIISIIMISFGGTSRAENWKLPVSLSATVSNIECDNSGTPEDALDDTFSFELEVTGAVNNWLAVIQGDTIFGQNNVAQSYDGYLIIDGDLEFLIWDIQAEEFIETVSITAPFPCSTFEESASISICHGDSVHLSADIQATTYTHYQWFKNGVPIQGANQDFFAATEIGSYHFEASFDGNSSCFDKICSPISINMDGCPHATLKIKTFLQGAMIENGGGDLMRDDLRINGLIPHSEPYSQLESFEPKGSGGGEVLEPSLLSVEGENAIVDWVFIELRDPNDSLRVVDSRAALLQRDGDVIDIDGDSLIHFYTSPNSGFYHVAVRHRNHLGAMTHFPVSVLDDGLLIDFSSVELFGTNSVTSINLNNALWSGNLNNDQKVSYQGPNNDVFSLLGAVLTAPNNTVPFPNFIYQGYDSADLNLDGQIIYQGPDNERSKLLFNIIFGHPANVNKLTNFTIEEQLPDTN